MEPEQIRGQEHRETSPEQEANRHRELRKKLEAELTELSKRLELAKRRIAGHEAEQAGNSPVWLGTPSEITAMKSRLQAACTDTGVVMQLVDELRQRREGLTNDAMAHYASANTRNQ